LLLTLLYPQVLQAQASILTGGTANVASWSVVPWYRLVKLTSSSDGDPACVDQNERDTLWKDADPDVPILKEAKAEYAKLQ
jgi:hypothetical protein